MKKVDFKTAFLVYETEQELPVTDQQLLQIARGVLGNAYAPYSKFHVAAAVMLSNGAIVTSTNYENASFPISVCAEHSALIAAANRYPDLAPVAVAITVKTPRQIVDKPALPCGSCRQVICETEQKNGQTIKVILQGETGDIFVFDSGKDMLPLAFDSSFL